MSDRQTVRGWLYYQAYSKTQKLLHRFDLHYAPEFGPIMPGGETQKWCQWCGLRMNIPAKNHPFHIKIDEPRP